MKFILIAAVALLALAQGSFAQEATDMEKLTKYIEEMKTKFTEIVGNPELVNQAQAFMTERQAQLEPMAAQIQEQLKAAAANMQEQVGPLAANMQEQFQPMITNLQEQMEGFMRKLMEQAPALGN